MCEMKANSSYLHDPVHLGADWEALGSEEGGGGEMGEKGLKLRTLHILACVTVKDV